MRPKLLAERGQALILIALAAIGLVAITGLAIDGSAKYSDRRHAQNAADAASLAAALDASDLMTGGESPSTCSTDPSHTNSAFCQHVIDIAWDRAKANGYDGLLSNDVNVYSPPISGPYSTSGSSTIYVQVIITSHVNTWFARILGIKETVNTVNAVSIAGKGGTLGDGAMIISYDDHPSCNSGVGSGGSSLYVSGNSKITLNGGGIFVNSQEHCGYYAPNCPDLTITGGGGINSVVDPSVNNIDQACQTAPENYDQTPVVIPTDISWPRVPDECKMTPKNPKPLGGKDWAIYPGYYTSFPPTALVGQKQHMYMASGIYCIDPGGPSKDWDLSWSSNDAAELNGSTDPSKNPYANMINTDGVTLYIKAGGGFQLNAKSPTILDATTLPTSDYQGYLIILEGNQSSIETCSIEGGADIDLNGMIFAPYCNITVNGGSDTNAKINAQLLGWDITLTGKAEINFKYDPKYTVKIKRQVGLMQ